MKFKAVIFDLDGTLVDSIEDIAYAMNTVLMQQGFPIHTVANYKQFVGSGLRNLTSKVLPGENQTENLIQSTFNAMFDLYSKNCVCKTKPYDGIHELLDELLARKIKIAVFSNKADSLTKKIVTTIFPEITFEEVVGLTVETHKKPNPIEAICISEKMKISPDQIIYVGDSGVDMQTAHNAGMFPVGVSWGYRSEEDLLTNGAQNIIHHPLELLNIIDQSILQNSNTMNSNENPIIVTQIFNNSIKEVWNAITELQQMKKWFFQNIPSFNPEVGFQTEFIVQSDVRTFTHLWKITEVIPYKKIKYEWSSKEHKGLGFVTFELTEMENHTLLRLTNKGLESFPQNIAEFNRESCQGGWEYFIQKNLKDYLTFATLTPNT